MPCLQAKTVLVTGAAGLIGRSTPALLRGTGYQVYAVSRRRCDAEDAHCLRADLLNPTEREDLFRYVKPTHLLHLAWDTRPGVYLESNDNFAWMEASLDVLRLFHSAGGRRAVMAGTCFEYAFSDEPLIETGPRNPQSTYARCKDHVNALAALFCRNNGVSYGWGRIFYVYGAGEQAGRFTPSIVDAARSGREMTIKGGSLRRDYMYSGDVAAAFAAFLDSDVEGEVNICSGAAVELAEYARWLARKAGREDVLRFEDKPGNQPPLIVGDNKRLREEVGFVPRFGLKLGFDAMLREESESDGKRDE